MTVFLIGRDVIQAPLTQFTYTNVWRRLPLSLRLILSLPGRLAAILLICVQMQLGFSSSH
ncbi:MAG: hypothetical protein ACI955_001667 [Zhongshania sp.]|jgi:hypothetical protein